MKKLKDITPEKFKEICSLVACPSVYSIEGNKNQLVIVGTELNPEELEGVKINKDEAAIMIDKEMIKQLFP